MQLKRDGASTKALDYLVYVGPCIMEWSRDVAEAFT